jgi:hypothetical protein
MAWTPFHTELRNTLSRLINKGSSIRRLAADAELPLHEINFDDNAETIWQEAIELADSYDQITNLILSAKDKFPRNRELATLYEEHKKDSPATTKVGSAWKGGGLGENELEALMGEVPTFLPAAFLKAGWQASQSVARVRTNFEFGTGFVIDSGVLITNNHVIPSKSVASDSEVDFDYETGTEGLPEKHTTLKLDAAALFHTCEDADLTAVRVAMPEHFKREPLQIGDKTPEVKSRVSIIQHPEGGRKRVALHRNIVLYSDSSVIQYLTDTLPGSSGSPVFDDRWRVVGVHCGGGSIHEPSTKQLVYRNQGVSLEVLKTCIEKWGICQ